MSISTFAPPADDMHVEHCPRRLVLDTLQEVQKKEPERKCFRLVGGILVERTVDDILPQVENTLENVRGPRAGSKGSRLIIAQLKGAMLQARRTTALLPARSDAHTARRDV